MTKVATGLPYFRTGADRTLKKEYVDEETTRAIADRGVDRHRDHSDYLRDGRSAALALSEQPEAIIAGNHAAHGANDFPAQLTGSDTLRAKCRGTVLRLENSPNGSIGIAATIDTFSMA